jgi:hypothetical protein
MREEIKLENSLIEGESFVDGLFNLSDGLENIEFRNCIFRNCQFNDSLDISVELEDCFFENLKINNCNEIYIRNCCFNTGKENLAFSATESQFSMMNCKISSTHNPEEDKEQGISITGESSEGLIKDCKMEGFFNPIGMRVQSSLRLINSFISDSEVAIFMSEESQLEVVNLDGEKVGQWIRRESGCEIESENSEQVITDCI